VNRVIVCDTGPLPHLNEANALHLLKPAGKILIPPSVFLELKHNAPHWKIPNWMLKGANRQAINWVRSGIVDSGEAESIGLALQMKRHWFLTDDAEARQFAETLGMEVHGSVGVLLWAVSVGYVENRRMANKLLDGLANSSLWISERMFSQTYFTRKALLS